MGSKKIECPACEEKFDLDEDIKVGETTYCPGCYADLKIIKLEPPMAEEEVSSSDSGDYFDD
ncbi:MAG: lysine biosynthesis protein LysW [Candidatus Omnitrophota bacterium]